MDHKQAEIASRTPAFMAHEASKPFGWDAAHFVEWATVTEILHRLGVQPGASAIDVGCGSGWTTLFLAEAGIDALGLDLVPANIELARERARRWQSPARFEVADMDALPDGPPVDLVLIFDALHHTREQRATLEGVFARLRPGGWLVLAEPTWLHRLSPEARRVRAQRGWLERGLTLRGLKRDLRASGFGTVRRFFQPTRPYEGRVRGFTWQLTRLVAADLLWAPQAHLWIAAERPRS
jgi:2-polyprenyl-3-methyl-5-hydroxy-6-metoxy-1,4-benzoquinol methylase